MRLRICISSAICLIVALIDLKMGSIAWKADRLDAAMHVELGRESARWQTYVNGLALGWLEEQSLHSGPTLFKYEDGVYGACSSNSTGQWFCVKWHELDAVPDVDPAESWSPRKDDTVI
jgi:hypothetical protein